MSLQRAQKVLARIEQLATISDRNDCICRLFGSEASHRANELVGKWMRDAELQVRVDNLLNIRGTKSFERSKTFLMGSHLDTVVNAGKFDGPLGVLLGLDQAERLLRSGLELPYDLEIIGFSDEEGVRFQTPYLGSRAVAGTFHEDLLKLKDAHQFTLGQVIREAGKHEDQIVHDCLPHGSLAGYLEVHIEQGPVLESLDLPVGLVSGIAAQQRYQVVIKGMAGHAGTVPMNLRQDALAGAAELILHIEQFVQAYASMVGTVGKLEVLPGVSNVIPEAVTLSVDMRHLTEGELNETIALVMEHSRSIAQRRGLEINWELQLKKPNIKCDKNLTKRLEKAIVDGGYGLQSLTSGAGHDGVIMSEVAPVCMLFVRCKGGISHNPLEETSLKDIQAAISVCDHFFNNL